VLFDHLHQVINAVEKNKGWGSAVTISDETDTVLETGGGLKKVSGYFASENNFVVMNVDILTDMDLLQMIEQHQQQQPLATLAVSDRETSRYFLFDGKNILSGWENVTTGEKKIVRNTGPLSRKAFSGIHVINASLFQLIKQDGKFSMVDLYLDLAKDHIISSYDHTGSALIDVGKPENILAAETIFT